METKKEKKLYFLWLDLETTGLDPDLDMILEIAWQITDKWGEYVHGMSGSALIQQPLIDLNTFCNPYVIDMHKKSGLLDEWTQANEEVEKSSIDTVCGDAQIKEVLETIATMCKSLRSVPGYPDAEIRIAGNSIHFDIEFLQQISDGEAWADTLQPILSHRRHDMTPVLQAYELRYGVDLRKEIPAMTHRAADDIITSIRYHRAAVGLETV